MSAEVRDLFVASLAALPVKVTPYYRQTTKPADGFVRLDLLNRDNSGFGYMATWQVCIVLPQDQNAAEKWIDAHSSGLLAALSTEGVVQSARPVSLALDSGNLPALVITVIREME